MLPCRYAHFQVHWLDHESIRLLCNPRHSQCYRCQIIALLSLRTCMSVISLIILARNATDPLTLKQMSTAACDRTVIPKLQSSTTSSMTTRDYHLANVCHWLNGASDKASEFVRSTGKSELVKSKLSVGNCTSPRLLSVISRLLIGWDLLDQSRLCW